jgi:hypothetical protein
MYSKATFNPLVCSISCHNSIISPTLNSSLGTNSRSKTEGSGHEVGENLVRAGRLVGSVFAETGDLQGRLVLVGAAERAIEGGGLGGLRQSSPLLAGGDGSAGGGQLLAGASAQQSARGGGERHDETSNCNELRGGEGGENDRLIGREEFDEVEVGGPA